MTLAGFHFKLAAVLRFRERVKQEKQWDLGLLTERMRRLEKEVHHLQEELRRDESRARTEGIYSAIELQLRGNYAKDLLHQIDQQRSAIAALNKDVTRKREELVEAMREVKVLEQLRQRIKEKFRLAADLADQKVWDEISLRKFIEPAKG